MEHIQQEEKKQLEALRVEMDTQSNYMIELTKRASANESRGGDFDVIGDTSEGLFTTSVKLYKCLIDEIQSKWIQRSMEIIDEPLKEYSKIKWQAYEIESVFPNKTPDPDPHMNKVTVIISNISHAVKVGMDEDLALLWIQKLAAELDRVRILFAIFTYSFRLVF